MSEYERKHEPIQRKPSAGPAADDRQGANAPTDIEARILKADVVQETDPVGEKHQKTSITIARGSKHGITVDLPGYIKGTPWQFHVYEVHDTFCRARVDATFDAVNATDRLVILNPVLKKPIQRRANGNAVTADVNATAQAGVAGANSPLPHFDAIQRAFGKHDISNIQAQIGGPAVDATRTLGAHAYATGNTVAFAQSPDLHTAAHEAAHVIQQQRGAVGFQGLGAADDEHERHADAVADAVVAGHSAESLLDGASGAGTQGAVQRKESSTHVTAEDLARAPVGSAAKTAELIPQLEAQCTREPSKFGCLLPENQRVSLVSEIRRLISDAKTNYKLAAEKLENEELMKKEDDLNWFVSLAIDVASAYFSRLAGQALAKIIPAITTTIAERATPGNLLGDNASQVVRSIDSRTLETNVRLMFDPVKKAIKAHATDDSAKARRQESISFLELLQDRSDASFDRFSLAATTQANDIEMLAIYHSFDPKQQDNHTISAYKKVLREKLEDYKKSGLTEIGRQKVWERDGHHYRVERDKRVVWVERDGSRTLHFQEQQGWQNELADNVSQSWQQLEKGKPMEFGARFPFEDVRLGPAVPDEFVDLAIERSEELFGPTVAIQAPSQEPLRNPFVPREPLRNPFIPRGNQSPAPQPASAPVDVPYVFDVDVKTGEPY